MPLFALSIAITTKKTVSDEKTHFRNLLERTDKPIFSIDDAIKDLHSNDSDRTVLEKVTDDFFKSQILEKI